MWVRLPLEGQKQKHMTSIIGWALLTSLHALNIYLYKDKPKGFWYKSSWFFLGWSSLSLIYAISDVIATNV
jgi:hypothetical protein